MIGCGAIFSAETETPNLPGKNYIMTVIHKDHSTSQLKDAERYPILVKKAKYLLSELRKLEEINRNLRAQAQQNEQPQDNSSNNGQVNVQVDASTQTNDAKTKRNTARSQRNLPVRYLPHKPQTATHTKPRKKSHVEINFFPNTFDSKSYHQLQSESANRVEVQNVARYFVIFLVFMIKLFIIYYVINSSSANYTLI